MKPKHILLITAFIFGWTITLTQQYKSASNHSFNLEQLAAIAGDSTENDPPPYPPPGRPAPPQDNLPPGVFEYYLLENN